VIDFKYHVVSIVAVFLALAVGIVLGTNVLSGDVLKNLKAETTQLRKDSQDLRAQVAQQQSQLDQEQSFANALEPIAVSGRLRHERIAVVTLPGASKSVRDQLVKTLTSAGATVTAEVDIADPYTDPTQQSTLDELVRSLAPATLDLTGDTTVSGRAAAVLAGALVVPISAEAAQASLSTGTAGTAGLTGPAGSAPPETAGSVGSTEPIAGSTPSGTAGVTALATPSPSTSAGTAVTQYLPVPVDPASVAVLAGLQKAGFVRLDQTPTEFATLAVVVAPVPPDKPATGATALSAQTAIDTASFDLITSLDDTGSGAIVGGPTGSAATGGLLAQLRTDSSMTKTVSSVDDVDTSAGQIALVYAVAVEASGRAGQYGTGSGAQAPLPTPPTPSASPAAAATPTPSS
jgi:hypothetical protein